jgi:hypothetical protein
MESDAFKERWQIIPHTIYIMPFHVFARSEQQAVSEPIHEIPFVNALLDAEKDKTLS